MHKATLLARGKAGNELDICLIPKPKASRLSHGFSVTGGARAAAASLGAVATTGYAPPMRACACPSPDPPAPFSLGRGAKYSGRGTALASEGGSCPEPQLFHKEPVEGASTQGLSPSAKKNTRIRKTCFTRLLGECNRKINTKALKVPGF